MFGKIGAIVRALKSEGLHEDASAVRQAGFLGKQAALSPQGQRVALQVIRNSGSFSTQRDGRKALRCAR